MTTMSFHRATYSPADNLLRLYTDQILDDTLYQRVTQAGFRTGPLTNYYAARWTPERRALCIKLVGEINPLHSYINGSNNVNCRECLNKYYHRADLISARYAMGMPIIDPILYSNRKDLEIDKYILRSASSLAKYRKCEYCFRVADDHPTLTLRPAERKKRIKLLLDELRTHQFPLSMAALSIDRWSEINKEENDKNQLVQLELNRTTNNDYLPMQDLYEKLQNGKINSQQVIGEILDVSDRMLYNEKKMLWLTHTLYRLGYERELLTGHLKCNKHIHAAILADFARTHGIRNPNIVMHKNGYALTSSVILPVHLGDGTKLDLSLDGWRSLLDSTGYEPSPKIKPPVLNVDSKTVKILFQSKVIEINQISMTTLEYEKMPTNHRALRISACGRYRVRVCRIDSTWLAVVLSDKGHHVCVDL